MRIGLKQLIFVNFKGLKSLTIDFTDDTTIRGMNETGKTTIVDGWLWLMFGKDSTDRKEFGIKTIENGKVTQMLDHEVTGTLNIWQSEEAIPRTMILKRTFREKWQKPRGKPQAEFVGNETIYNVDGVPCTMKEYMDKIDSLCPEALFKLLTNPNYFPGLNWSIQRASLFALIPEVTNEDIIASIPLKTREQGKFDDLIKIITKDKTVEDYMKQIASEKRKLKEELDQIPARIDEVNRGMPPAENWTELEIRISSAEAFVRRKETEKTDKLASVEGESTKRADLQSGINTRSQRMTAIKNEIENSIREEYRTHQQKIQEIKSNLGDYEGLIERATNSLADYKEDLQELQSKRNILIDDWKAINANVFQTSEDNTHCFNCHQVLPDDMLNSSTEEAIAKFSGEKNASLAKNKEKGLIVKNQISGKEAQINETIERINKLNTDRAAVRIRLTEADQPLKTGTVEERLAAHEEYQKIYAEHTNLESTLKKLGPIAAIDTEALDKEISFAREKILEDKTTLTAREVIAKANERKAELEGQQKKLSQEIADREQMQFSIESFIFRKITMLEEQINSLFDHAKFKMFDMQINGQLVETCEVYYKGVPYSDLNRAAKINIGLDIINTMSRAHGIIAPIFIDNAESTNEFIPTKAQMVKLYVTLDKTLIIN